MESDDHDDQGASQTNQRSYECNFCKRGFSNAQALGGHMNIHRKDKAKLKQQFLNPSLEGKSSEEPNKPNLNLNVSQQEPSRDEIQMRLQLPLFAESPIITTTEIQKPQGQIHGIEEGGQGSSLELDLELRLGPEPQDSSAATGIRKFF